MARPWKNPATGVYYCRKRVPLDVRALIGGPEIIKRSLQTKDPKEAPRRFRKVEAEIEADWDRIRKHGGRPPQDVAPAAGASAWNSPADPIRLTDKQVEALAGEVYDFWQARYADGDRSHFESFRGRATAGALRRAMSALSIQHRISKNETLEDASDEMREIIGPYVDVILEGHGLAIDGNSRRRLDVASGRAVVQAIGQFQREAAGDWRPDPDADRFPKLEIALPEPPNPDHQFEVILEKWRAKRKETSKSSIRRYRPTLENLVKFAGTKDMSKITTETVTAFLEHLEAKGTVSPATIKNVELAAIRSVFKWAHARGLLPSDPTARVFYEVPKPKGEGKDDQRGFYDDEAHAILKASLQPPSRRLGPHMAATRRWVPWILAYTGARVAEITQLRAMDVRVIDNTWCIVIEPKAGAVKDDQRRIVPLHDHLIEQGFLEFAQKKKGRERLFYDEKPGVDASEQTPQYGEVAGRLGRWVRERLEVTAEDVDPNHGWRHRFKARAILAGILERHVDQIQGHAPTTAGKKYGPLEPSLLRVEVCKYPRYKIGA